MNFAIYNYARNNTGKLNFTGDVIMSANDKFSESISNNLKAFIERCQNELPENFKLFPTIQQAIKMPQNDKIALLGVSGGYSENPKQATLTLGVRKAYSDMERTFLLKNGSKQEIIDELISLNNQDGIEKLKAQINKLSLGFDK